MDLSTTLCDANTYYYYFFISIAEKMKKKKKKGWPSRFDTTKSSLSIEIYDQHNIY